MARSGTRADPREAGNGLVDRGAMMVSMSAAGPGTPALATTAVIGLTSAEVEDRVRQGLVNDVPTRASRTTADIVRTNVFTPFNGLLGALLVAILWVGPYNDALFGFVIVANTLIGIVQEDAGQAHARPPRRRRRSDPARLPGRRA